MKNKYELYYISCYCICTYIMCTFVWMCVYMHVFVGACVGGFAKKLLIGPLVSGKWDL